ncbi:MAG: hypothetical protein ACK4K7_05885 [Allosphingosinicella sp.]|uniref:hypothetical protein n=1 Tax=Allosphingosinicella sp. TaxID=2823234 RepID=UPI003939C1EA
MSQHQDGRGGASHTPARPNHALTAALIGGAAAAAAGAVWGARRYARGGDGQTDGDGAPLNAVMKNALTATELGCGGRAKLDAKAETPPKEPAVPSAPTEPSVPG